MKLQRWTALACALVFSVTNVFGAAVGDFSAVVSQIQNDSALLSDWLTAQFKYAVPFNATSGNVVPGQLKVFGVELGVEGVVSGTQMDVAGLRNLGTSVVDASKIDAFNRFPMPAVLAHAKIGLPFGLDAGVRVGGIPSKSFDEGTTRLTVKNGIFGIDVRRKIIEEGMAKPFGLTLGLNFTRAGGSIDVTEPYSSQSQVTANNVTYNAAFSATGKTRSEWDVKSLGLQAVLNKQVLFLNPYLGASANRNFGSLSASLTTAGTGTITKAGDPSDASSQSFSTVGAASSGPNKWDIRALAGVEFTFLPFLKLGLHGEYAGAKNASGAVGLRFQFR